MARKKYIYIHTFQHCIGHRATTGERLHIEAVQYYSTEEKALAAKKEKGGRVSKEELL